MADLETDEAMLKIVAFLGACLTCQGQKSTTIMDRSKKFYTWLAEWLDDSTGE
jgi:hypothetical protein